MLGYRRYHYCSYTVAFTRFCKTKIIMWNNSYFQVNENFCENMDLGPLWSYHDRGYYSVIFVGETIYRIDLYLLSLFYIVGYIFLYTILIRVLKVPTPSVHHFKQFTSDVSCYQYYIINKFLAYRIQNRNISVKMKKRIMKYLLIICDQIKILQIFII